MNILLVEDDAGIGRFVTRGLAVHGHHVAWYRQGGEVANIVAANRFCAVLLDLGLPDMDGLDLCRLLRDQCAGLQILMLTARGSLEEKLEGFAAGADDYLPKPFAFEELLARLAVFERRSGGGPTAPLRLGDLAIDDVAREIRWRNRVIPLDGRGFRVLRCLAQARGATVQRAAIIEAVWGVESDVTDNALDVNISALRRRLASLSAPPVIRTHRGQGFSLDVQA